MANTKIVNDPVLHQLRMERTLMERLDAITEGKRSRNSLIVELLNKALDEGH